VERRKNAWLLMTAVVVVLGFEDDEEGEDGLMGKMVITYTCENLRGILVRSCKFLMCQHCHISMLLMWQ